MFRIFRGIKEFGIVFCGLRQSNTSKILEQGEGVRREPQSFTIPTRFARVPGPIHRTGGLQSQNCLETPRYSSSELHL